MEEDLLPPGWFGEHLSVLGESHAEDRLDHGLPYHACCMTCMMNISVPMFAYGRRCGCIVHFECAQDSDNPETCIHHPVGSNKMVVYAQMSDLCVTGCGSAGEDHDGIRLCSVCSMKIKASLERAVKLLWCGKPPPKPQFFMDLDEAEDDTPQAIGARVSAYKKEQIASGAPVQSLYRVMMRNSVLWPIFFGGENMVDAHDLDVKTLALHYRVHPAIHVMWEVVVWFIRNDPAFYFDQETSRVWMSVMWIETGFLKLPVDVYPYPDVIFELDEYKRCVESLSPASVETTKRLLRMHIRESALVLLIDRTHIRKRTPYNVYSASRLLEEVSKEEHGKITLLDIYAEDKNADKFVASLVGQNSVVVINHRLYPCSIIPEVPGLADKLLAGRLVEQ